MQDSHLRKVPVNEGWTGFVLGKDVLKSVNGNNVLLRKAGTRLTKDLLMRFENHGITHIYVINK